MRIKIKVKYRGEWYFARNVYINEEGKLDIEYCEGVVGSIDSEHVKEIKLIEIKEDGGTREIKLESNF